MGSKEVNKAPAEPSNFDFGRDMDSRYLQIFREAGFSQVKRWYQPQNHVFRCGSDLLSDPLTANLSSLDGEVREAVKATYDELSGAESPDLRTFEAMVILAFKD